MTKESAMIINNLAKMKKDFASALENVAISLIETALNRHKEDEVTIMFPKAHIAQEEMVSSGAYDKAIGINIVTGVKMVKKTFEDENDVYYKLYLLNENGDVSTKFDYATLTTKVGIVEEIVEIVRTY